MAAEPPTNPELEALVDRYLVRMLDASGHGMYLVHPRPHETVLVAFSLRQSTLEDTRERLRKVLLGIVAAAAALEDRKP